MKLLRLSLLVLTLCVAFGSYASGMVKLTGPVSARQLSALPTLHPDMATLDLKDATIEGDLIPAGAFAGTDLQSLILPANGAISIGDGAFMSTNITNLVIPKSIKAIGTGAFAACSSLKSVVITDCEIGDYAFHLCTNLSEANLGESTAVGSHAFAGCSSLRTLTTSGALRSIGDFAFAHTGLIGVELGNCKNLTQIGGWAFADNPSLAVIHFPADAELGEGILFNCPALSEIVLPVNLPEVPAYAFTGSKGSNGYYTLPDNVEAIGAFAYKDTDLGHIVLPSSLKSIGTGAMENTPKLSIIDAGNVAEVPELGEDVWKGVDKDAVQLLVPQDMTADYKAALQWQDFKLDVSSITSPEIGEVAVKGAFDGDNLIIESQGSDIAQVEIFNESGALFFSQSTQTSLISIPAGHLALSLFLVRCTLADGTVATLKLTH